MPDRVQDYTNPSPSQSRGNLLLDALVADPQGQSVHDLLDPNTQQVKVTLHPAFSSTLGSFHTDTSRAVSAENILNQREEGIVETRNTQTVQLRIPLLEDGNGGYAPSHQASQTASGHDTHDYHGALCPSCVLEAYEQLYADDEQKMQALFTVLVVHGYAINTEADFWWYDNDVDHQRKIIHIDPTDDVLWTRSPENAAQQLYQALADNCYGLTDLDETWGGFGTRVAGGVLKTGEGVISVVGGTALVLAPDVTLLTKVGGTGAIVCGGNSIIEGGTQVFNRSGGINLISEAAGAYGQWMAGDEGEASARYFIGWSTFCFEVAGGGGLTKAGTMPMQHLPAHVRTTLSQIAARMRARHAARLAEEVVEVPRTFPIQPGGTGAAYNELTGQGIYILRDSSGKIRYVGRGDAPARIRRHALPGSGLEDLDAQILFNNNLPAAQAQNLEQELIQMLGGPKSVNPGTSLRNKIQGIGERNPEFLQLEFAADDDLVIEALRRAGLLGR